MSQSMTFTIEGEVETQITIIENGDGTLTFEIDVLGDYVGDLRGLFFDLNFDVPTDDMQVTAGADVTGIESGEEDISRIAKDVNLKGEIVNEYGAFDVGIEFGTSGIGKDDILTTEFTLSSDSTWLTLAMLEEVDFGLRYTSVGDIDGSREESLKIGGTSGTITDDTLDFYIEPTDDNAMPVPPLEVTWTSGTSGTVSTLDGSGNPTSTETFSGIKNFILGDENDIVNGAPGGEQTYDLKGGEDDFNGGAADETVIAGNGDDNVDGGAGDDVIDGGQGDDILSGGDGRDSVTGGLGDDLVIAGAGDAVLDGSEGDELNGDTLDLSGIDLGGAGITLDLGTGVVSTPGTIDAALNFENVIGTAGADFITGNADDNTMTGGDGADEFIFHLSGPGIGDNVITDFNIGDGDLLVVFGMTDPNSPDPMMPDMNYLPDFNQVGNDVVISFVDADSMIDAGSVTLTNTTFDPSLFDSLVLM